MGHYDSCGDELNKKDVIKSDLLGRLKDIKLKDLTVKELFMVMKIFGIISNEIYINNKELEDFKKKYIKK